MSNLMTVSTIRKRFVWRKPLLSKKDLAARLRFARLYMNNTKTSGNMSSGLMTPEWG